MATEDKAAHKATAVKGKIKEGVGQAEGNLKQAGDKIKDVFKK
jgi:uncharacterized protein YjbJ (UPF0337 family)